MARPKRSRPASNTEAEPDASTSHSTPAEDTVPDDSNVNESDVEPAPKKRKIGKSAAKKGSRKNNMPLQDTSAFGALCADVLIEIFSYLSPLDLLHVSWTSKGLSTFLTSDWMASLWRNAKRSLPEGLPDCPTHIKEPQFANLLFGDHCFFCLRQYELSELEISWTEPYKVCGKCVKKKTLFVYQDEKRPEQNKWMAIYPAGFLHYLPSVEQTFGHHRIRKYYLLETHKKWKGEYQNSTNKKKWVGTKTDEQNILYRYARDCKYWLNHSYKDHVLQEREDMIIDRIKRLGWQGELDKIVPRTLHPLHSPEIREARSKRLTDSDLIALEPSLNKIMNNIRSLRLSRERRSHLKNCLPVLHDTVKSCQMNYPPNYPTPHTGDIFLLPTILSTINSSSDTGGITKEDLDPLVEAYPDIAREWKLETEAELLEMIRRSCGESYAFDPSTVLHLATTFFSCCECRGYKSSGPVWYPRVLLHDHARNLPIRDSMDLDTEMVYDITRSTQWNARNVFQFNNADRLIMWDILKEAGFDPETTTAEELNTLDPIFECVPCNNIRQGRFTMKWTHLVDHILENHSKPGLTGDVNPYKLEILQGQDAECIRGRFAEDNAFERADSWRYRDCMICVHCKAMQRPVELADHVWAQHGIDNPTEADMVRNIDVPFLKHFRYSWPPRKERREPKV